MCCRALNRQTSNRFPLVCCFLSRSSFPPVVASTITFCPDALLFCANSSGSSHLFCARFFIVEPTQDAVQRETQTLQEKARLFSAAFFSRPKAQCRFKSAPPRVPTKKPQRCWSKTLQGQQSRPYQPQNKKLTLNTRYKTLQIKPDPPNQYFKLSL